MTKIKLLKIGETKDGTVRLQSQLLVGRDVADFIMKDEVLKHWGKGNKGFDFYIIDTPFEIVNSKEDMKYQQL